MLLHATITIAAALTSSQQFEFEDPRYLSISLVSARRVELVDLNQDGHDDLLFANTVVYWVEKRPQGGFAVAHEVASFPDPVLPYSLDMDADGDLDIVLAAGLPTGGDELLWLENEFEGRFASVPHSLELFPGGASAEVLDLDGDGLLDILVRHDSDPTTVDWMRNEGGGVFRARERFVTILIPLWSELRTFDLGGDGDLDLLIGTNGNGLWSYEKGPGSTFGPAVPLDLSVDDTQVSEIVDIDGDGLLDIVTLAGVPAPFISYDRIRVYRGATSGGLEAPVDILTLTSGDTIAAARIADVTGDGDADIVVGTQFARQILIAAGNGVGYLPPTTVATTSSGGYRLWDIVELDGVPGADALVSGSNGLQLLTANSSGPLERAVRLVGTGSRDSTVVGDLEGDGDLDVVHTDGRRRCINLGRGRFECDDLPIVDGIGGEPSAADLDNDGDLELLGRSFDLVRWVDNLNGTEFGAAHDVSFQGFWVRGYDVVDVDGDGWKDIVSTGPDLAWARGLGAGSFASPQPLLAMAGETWGLEFVDLDDDGDLDMVSVQRDNNSRLVKVHTNHTLPGGPANFVEISARPLAGIDPMVFLAGDLDGDGDQDVLQYDSLDSGSFALAWLENDGAGGLAPAVELLPECRDCTSIALRDLDLDGDLDIFGAQPSTIGPLPTFGEAFWLENPGSPPFSPAAQFGEGLGSRWRTLLADLDDDGDQDLVMDWFALAVRMSTLVTGELVCAPAAINSFGVPASLRATGSRVPEDQSLALVATDLPAFTFGMAITSRDAATPSPVPGSSGLLCLGGTLGRLNGPGQIQSSGSEGRFRLDLDLASLPLGPAGTPALPGETWFFQVWYRDNTPSPTSNFTNAVEVRFR